jgi:hypothetical protein
MEFPKIYKPLLAIRRKARRAGGHVAPGMRKHIYPTQVKKPMIIDLAMLPANMTSEEYINQYLK